MLLARGSFMADTKTKFDSDSDSLGFNEKELEDIMSEIENLEKEFVAPDELVAMANEELKLAPSEELKINSSEVTMTDLQRQIDEELENSLKRIEEMEKVEASGPDLHSEEITTETSTDFDNLDSIESISSASTDMLSNMSDIDEVDSLLMEADHILDNAENEHEIAAEIVDQAPVMNEMATESTLEEKANVLEMKPIQTSTNATKMSPTLSTQPMSFQAEGQMSMMMSFKIGESEANLKVNGNSGITLSFDGVEVVISEETGCVVEMSNGVKFNIPLSSKTTKRNVA